MPTTATAPRLLTAVATLGLLLAGCAGSDTGDLPTADDLGAGDAPVTSGMCVEDEPDCEDMIVTGPGASSCLQGDEDCTDESYGGGDQARPIPLVPEPSGAEPAERGATSGASGRFVTSAHLLDDSTLELTFDGGACDLVEDVVVNESPAEVRVLVLVGQDAAVEACTEELVQLSTTITLDEPLGDRALLDLAG